MSKWTDTSFTRRLGVAYPIIQGPFGPGSSSVRLTAAVSNAGGSGSFGANDLGPEDISIRKTIRRDAPLRRASFVTHGQSPETGPVFSVSARIRLRVIGRFAKRTEKSFNRIDRF